MEGNEGGGDNPPTSSSKRIRVEDRGGDPKMDIEVGSGGERNDSYLPFLKPNYKRLYPENSDTVLPVSLTPSSKDASTKWRVEASKETRVSNAETAPAPEQERGLVMGHGTCMNKKIDNNIFENAGSLLPTNEE
ncbi:hypothetical protein RR46_08009 [Papilio xuthus]|uniref:Uncharacterized protein n=1 Tax=Papilio xuthus TaxID=66420 RepID=A0A194Q9M2_PAPXU|nr:hypothetical protein RR46_08009 [Papilio xuthus]